MPKKNTKHKEGNPPKEQHQSFDAWAKHWRRRRHRTNLAKLMRETDLANERMRQHPRMRQLAKLRAIQHRKARETRDRILRAYNTRKEKRMTDQDDAAMRVRVNTWLDRTYVPAVDRLRQGTDDEVLASKITSHYCENSRQLNKRATVEPIVLDWLHERPLTRPRSG